MNQTKITTIMIEDTDRLDFRERLDKVLERYDKNKIINIDTGMVHNGYSNGLPKMYYYAIIIVEGKGYKEELAWDIK